MIRPPKLLELNASSIIVFYLVFALLWILLSDQLLIWFTNDPLLISRYQTLKGILYVLVTALFLFFLITKSNEKISDRKERIDNALYAAGMATWSVDLKTKKIRRSKFHHKILGFSKKPRPWNLENYYSMIHPEDRAFVREKLEKTIQEKLSYYQIRYRIVSPDKNIRWMESRGNLIYNSNNKPVQLAGVIADITEQKKLEEEHSQEQELFKSIFDNIPVLINIHDENGHVYRVNKFFEEKAGYTNAELDSIDLIKEMIPDDEILKSVFAHIKKADGTWKDLDIKTKSGNIIHTTWTNIKVSDNLSVGIGIDTTELKQKERELEELTFRYKQAEKIAGFGHWKRIIETDEAIWSDGFYEVIGLEKGAKEPGYQNLLDMIHPDDREDFDEAFNEALETGTLNVRYRLIKPNTGEVGYYQELAKTEYDEHGNPISISGTVQDMTEQEEFQIKLKHRNDFIETTLENLPIGVAVNLMDSGTATLMNKKFTEIYGWPEEVINDVDTFFKKVYPDEAYRNRIIEMIQADIRSNNPDRMNWNGVKITTQTGEEKIINAKNIPLPEQNLMISTVVDVTAQAEAEKRLADSEYNYRLLFQKSPQPMWIYNPENLQFIEVNNAATKHYGYTRKEFHEMTLLDIRPEEDHDRLKKEISEGKRIDLSDAKEWRHLKKSGEIIYVRITGSSINYFGNKYRLILVNDVTEQKKAEERVLASLVEGENKERARIARELHDGLGQYLAAANMNLDAVRDDIEALTKRKQEQFTKGLNLLKHAVTETGQISRNLLPRVVDDYGLAFAIESLVDNYSSSADAKITYYHNLKDLSLPREVQFNLYRIAQEGLSNAVKYSEASQINVQLIKDELDLILSIDDNGNGFDPSSNDFIPGLGLRTIETRTGALGGNFEFDSKPNKGTFLSVIIPIHTNSKPS
ncbi:MAG: PAS domain S-box protein [Gracilimonas sp.]|uniref:PAS domain S-box protein n=1 Tax=Gracilimonas sp. TaxID=1974203 RepID=UPI001999E2A6|nr:PAS domain S-box protein [Gracilimonas sp.]MBD3616919.1 PAS domain S-box protein [Gracilimonas sp.]